MSETSDLWLILHSAFKFEKQISSVVTGSFFLMGAWAKIHPFLSSEYLPMYGAPLLSHSFLWLLTMLVLLASPLTLSWNLSVCMIFNCLFCWPSLWSTHVVFQCVIETNFDLNNHLVLAIVTVSLLNVPSSYTVAISAAQYQCKAASKPNVHHCKCWWSWPNNNPQMIRYGSYDLGDVKKYVLSIKQQAEICRTDSLLNHTVSEKKGKLWDFMELFSMKCMLCVHLCVCLF